MPDYRLYYLGGDGSLGLADWIAADSDEQAIAEARKLRPDLHRGEIWRQKRLIATINSEGAAEFPAHP